MTITAHYLFVSYGTDKKHSSIVCVTTSFVLMGPVFVIFVKFPVCVEVLWCPSSVMFIWLSLAIVMFGRIFGVCDVSAPMSIMACGLPSVSVVCSS